jgi:hypothetical protein
MSHGSRIRTHGRIPLLLLACAAGPGFAQTCASPIVVMENTVHTGTTCGAGDSLPFIGPFESQNEDVIYTLATSPALGGMLSVNADFTASVYLLPPPCAPSTQPIAAELVAPAGGAAVPLSGWPPGPKFVVITAAPGMPPGTCGTYSLSAQTFLVDEIFADGFEPPA